MEYLHEYYWPILLIPSSLLETTTPVVAFLRSQRSIQVNQWANKTCRTVGCAVDRLTGKCKWRLSSKEHQTKQTLHQKKWTENDRGDGFPLKIENEQKGSCMVCLIIDINKKAGLQKLSRKWGVVGCDARKYMCVWVCVSWQLYAG